jgi:phosphatidylglycerol---prolipoprotein diacylglyceryl transferase
MWQTLPLHISPFILQTPWFSLHWYGFMYVVAYVVIGALVMFRLRNETWAVSKDDVVSLLLWSIVGLAVGGRIGYAIFYEPSTFIHHPLLLVWPFEQTTTGLTLAGLSGFSYHGGLVGIIIATLIYCRRHHIKPLDVADLFLPAIPLGYFFGRLGNFINGELYGRVTSVPWAMIFPTDPLRLPRHPSELYEALLEGILIFAILWPLRKKRPFRGWTLPVYLVLYGLARFFVEFYREPDPQLGFVFGPFTMGQILSGLMILAGVVLFAVFRRRTPADLSSS